MKVMKKQFLFAENAITSTKAGKSDAMIFSMFPSYSRAPSHGDNEASLYHGNVLCSSIPRKSRFHYEVY
jgi:hypothetical protein